MTEVRHTVIVITYNQRTLLPICLDSIFNQSIMPFQVIIGDDCSNDGTREVVLKYKEMYPNIIDPVLNERNLGVFENHNNLKQYVKGNIVTVTGGDDYFLPGMFEEINRRIHFVKADLVSGKFIVVTNSCELSPDGKVTLFNNYQLKNKSLLKARIRNGLSYRDVGMSRALFDSLGLIRTDIGYFADMIYTTQQIVNAEAFYFLDKAFAVYRKGIGVTVSDPVGFLRSYLMTLEIFLEKYTHAFDRHDLKYLSYTREKATFWLKPTILGYLKLFFLTLYNFNNFTPNNSFAKNIVDMSLVPIRAVSKRLFKS